MMKELITEYPAQKGLVITKEIPIRSKAAYSGEFRELPDHSRRLIAAWAESMNVPGMPQGFQPELRVFEDGVEFWVPVQEVLVPTMKGELRPDEEIELFVIYIGQVEGRDLFLVNAFTHEGRHWAGLHAPLRRPRGGGPPPAAAPPASLHLLPALLCARLLDRRSGCPLSWS